jgi:hypothetical protein
LQIVYLLRVYYPNIFQGYLQFKNKKANHSLRASYLNKYFSAHDLKDVEIVTKHIKKMFRIISLYGRKGISKL